MGLWDEIKDFGEDVVDGVTGFFGGGDNPTLNQQPLVMGTRPQQQGSNPFEVVNAAYSQPEHEYDKPLWMQGADQQSPYSSWDSSFLERMFKQQENLTDKGKLSEQFDRDNATGVVTWDHVTKGGKELKFGDVFDKGKFVGNLYEHQGAEGEADLMMSQFLLEPEELANIGQDRDPSARLRDAVKRVHDENNISIPQALAAATQQKEVDKAQGALGETLGGLGGDVAAFGTGAAGGAAIGSIAGPVGTAVGAAVGGLAGWLNRDDITEQIASAQVISEQALRDEQGTLMGDVASISKQWAGVAGRGLAPVSNLARGVMDADRGNGVGALQEEDRPSWAKPLDIAASIADMGLTFGSKAGLTAYSGQMGVHTVGSVAELTVGAGYRWDAQAGQFRNVYQDAEGDVSVSNGLAAWGATGIDVAQMAMVRGVKAKIDGVDQKLIGRELNGGTIASVESHAGRTFFLDANKKALGSKVNITEAFVPSEAVKMLAAGGAARGALAKAGTGRALGADDVYKASVSLTRAEAPVKAALVNAIGEGTEEAAQEALDTWSLDHKVNLQSLAEAYAYGAAGGLGMGLAMNYRTRRDDDAQLKQLTREGFEAQHGTVSDREWDQLYKSGLSAEQQRAYRASSYNEADREAMKKALGDAVAEQGGTTANDLLITNAVAKAMESEQERLASVAGVSGRTIQRIGANTFQSLKARNAKTGSVTIQNGAVADDSGATGFTGLLTQYREKLTRLPEILRSIDAQIAQAEVNKAAAGAEAAGEYDALIADLQDTRALWEGAQPTLEKIIKEMESVSKVLMQPVSGDGLTAQEVQQRISAKRQDLDKINQYLDSLYRSSDDSVALAAAKFQLRPPFDNVGSFRVAAPALDWTMVRDNFDGTETMDWAALDTTTADFDGDRLTGTTSMVLGRRGFRNARTGKTWLYAAPDKNGNSVTSYKVASNEHDEALAVNMHLVHKRMRTPEVQGAPMKGVKEFVKIVARRYQLTKSERAALQSRLVSDVLETRNDKPIEALMEYVSQAENAISEKMLGYAEANRSNEASALAGIYRAVVDQVATEINEARVAQLPPAVRDKVRSLDPNVYKVGQEVQSQQAATLHATFYQYYGTTDPLRIGQVLRQSAEDYTDTGLSREQQNALLASAGAELRLLAKGKIEAAYDEGLDPFDVTARVHEMALDITSGNAAEAFALLTRKFGQASWDGKQTIRAEHDVTVAQALTDSVVAQLRRQGAAAIARDPDLQRKLDLLETAARDTQSADKTTRANGEMMILRDALGMFNVADVIGIGSTEGWETSGLKTQGTILQNTRILGQYERADRASIRKSMDAAAKNSAHPELYRELVALIHEFANTEYSVDRVTGKVHGRVADRNRAAADSAREIRQNVRKAVKALGLPLTHDGVLEALSTQNGPAILEAFTKQTGISSFVQREDGSHSLRRWVLDYFTTEKDGEAEVLLWRNRAYSALHLASARKELSTSIKDRVRDTDLHDEYLRVDDSLARLITYLRDTNPMLLSKLEIEMNRATSRESLEEWINANAAGFQMPVLMFENSPAQFDPSLRSGGWGAAAVSYGSDVREVTELSRTFLARSSEMVDRRKVNVAAARGILDLVGRDPNHHLVRSAEARYAEAVESNLVMTLDPNDIRDSGVMIHEFGQEMYTKGADLEAIRAYSAQQIRAQLQSGRVNPLIDATNLMLGVLDIAVLRERPELIFTTSKFVNEQGQTVDVPPLTREVKDENGVISHVPDIKLIMQEISRDSETGLADLLSEAGLPRAHKYNKQADVSTVVHRGPRNLQELFEERYDRAFDRSGNKYTSEANMVFASEVSAAAQVADQAQVAAFERAALVVATPRILSARTTLQPTEVGAIVDETHNALSTVFRMAGQFINSAEGSEDAYRDQVMEAARELAAAQTDAQRLRHEQSGKFRSLTTSSRVELNEQLAESLAQSVQSVSDRIQLNALMARIDAGRFTKEQEQALGKELVDGRASAPLVKLFRDVAKGDPYAEYEYLYGTAKVQSAKQISQISAYLREHNLAGKTLHDKDAKRALAFFSEPNSKLAADDWAVLRNVVLSHRIQTEANPVNAESDFLVVFKDPLNQDPTFATQFKAMLLPDSPLVEAAIKVTKSHPVPVDVLELRRAMGALFPADGSIRWDQSIGAMTEALSSTYPSISAGQAATIHGDTAKAADAFMMAARTNYGDVPGQQYLRSVTVKRTVDGLQVIDADGRLVDDTVLDGAIGLTEREITPMVVEGLQAPYRGMTIQRLEQALLIGEEMQVQYFDPAHRPAGARWHNSLYFDGVPAYNSPIVPSFPSLIAWLYMQPNGITQRGTRFTLDAVKKNLPAVYKVAVTPQGNLDLAKTPDLGGALLAMAKVLSSTELGYGTAGPASVRALLKQITMRHVVRYSDGEVVSVYEYQAAKDADPDGTAARAPELVPLSERTANTFYGEVGMAGLQGTLPSGQLAYGQRIFSWDALDDTQKAVLDAIGGPAVPLGQTSAAKRSALGSVSRGQQTEFRTAVRDFGSLYALQSEQADIQTARHTRLTSMGTTIAAMQKHQRDISNQLLKDDTQAAAMQALPDSQLESLVATVGQQDPSYATAMSYRVVVANQGNPAEGVITPGALPAFRKNFGEMTFGDSVVLALDDFTEQDIADVEKIVRYMIGRKVTITVRGGKAGPVRDAVRRALDAAKSDYIKVEGPSGTFAPIESVATHALERAYISRAMEQRNTSANSRLLTFIPEEGQPGFNSIGESSAMVINPNARRVVRGALIKQFASEYATPVHDANVDLVTSMLSDPETVGALRSLAVQDSAVGMTHKDAVEDLIQRASQRELPLTTQGLLIQAGMYEVYVLTPRQAGDKPKLYLHRVGDKFIKGEKLEEFLRTGDQPFILSENRVTEKQQTLVEGRVVSSAVRGDGVKLAVASDQFWRNNKLIPHLGANKVMTQGLSPELEWLQQEIAEELALDLVVNSTDNSKKLSMMDTVRSFGSAAELLGYDMMGTLYRGMWNGETYNSSDPDSQERMRALRSMLGVVAQNSDGRHTDVEGMISMLAHGSVLDPNVVLLTTLAESDPDAVNQLGNMDRGRPEARVLLAAMAYLTLPNTSLSDIEHVGGFASDQARDPGRGSRRLPDMFTQIFEVQDIREMALRELNGRLSPSVTMLDDYSVRIEHAGGSAFGHVAFTTYSVVGEAQGLNYDPTVDQGVSPHDSKLLEQAMSAFFANNYNAGAFTKFIEDATAADTVTPIRALPSSYVRAEGDDKPLRQPWWNIGVAQATYRARAADKLSYFFDAINLSDSGGDAADVENTRTKIREFAKLFFLDDSGDSDMHVHAMIRLVLGRPGASNDTEVEAAKISLSKIDMALESMTANYMAGYTPLRRGAVSLMPLEIRNAYIQANAGKQGTIKLQVWTGKKLSGEFADTADSITRAFFDHALGDPEANNIDSFNMVMDGVYHQYQQSSADAVSLPVSLDLALDLKLLSKDFQAEAALKQAMSDKYTMAEFAKENPAALATSLWRSQELLLTPTVLHELTNSATIAQKIGMNDLMPGEGLAPTQEVLEYVEKRLAAYNRKRDIPFPTKRSSMQLRDSGVAYTDSDSNAHRIMRNLLSLHAGKALFNPPLMIGALVDSTMRRGIVDTRRLLTGESVGFVGQRLANVVESQGRVGALARGFGWRTMFTQKQAQDLKDILNTTALTGPMNEVIYEDLASYSSALSKDGVIKPIKWLNKAGAALQDLGYGTKGGTMRRNYLQAAISDAVLRRGASLDRILAELRRDGGYLKKAYPDSHMAGVQAMNDLRGVQETVISSAVSSAIRPLTHSGNAGINAVAQMTLAMPLMFQRYASNLFLTLTGARALDQLAAHALNGRKKPGFWRAIEARAKSEAIEANPNFDMSEVIGGLDAMDAVINMGITHSLLFTGGLVAGGLGLSGEDEEERRRRRAAAAQGMVWLNDPRDIENDFRNAHALFLDEIPGLNILFANDAGRAIASPHWIIKPLTSPLLGMQRFFDTGDIRQLKWGFEDAITSMPLLNMVTFNKAVTMSEELSYSAQDAAASGNLGASDSAGFLTHLVGYYEHALFESSFLNALYVGFDEYDRDPYVMPLRDSDGDLQRDAEGNTRANRDQHLRSEGLDGNGLALQTYVDDEGNVQQGYWTESDATTQSRIFAESRLSYALISSLVTGLSGKGMNTRYDMAVKTREVEKPELSEKEQDAILMAMFAAEGGDALTKPGEQTAERAIALSFLNEHGDEVLTDDGAEAVFRGIAGGTMTPNQAYLQGVHLTYDQRVSLQERFLDELTIEGMRLGLSESSAKYRAGRVWNGTGELPGMADLLWSKDIPYSKTQEFQQLNTTYLKGPDGNMWASGFERTKLMGALGLAPLQGMHTSADTRTGMDGRMNVAGFGINNTGMRSLRPVNDSLDTPTDAEIGDAITKAIEGLDLSDYGGGYGRGYGGGGGGGGGYAQRPTNRYYDQPRWTNQNFSPITLRVPYANDVYAIQTETIRTDSGGIRRERISSERGRLTQWQ